MKGIVFIFLALTLSIGLTAQVLTCYDIQYTEDPAGNSPYNGQTVTVSGIVTAIRAGHSFWIGDPEGGPWSGLYIFHGNTANTVSLGDHVQLTGRVEEYFNLTELVSVTASTILSRNNPIPITTITTADLPYNNAAVSEKWEGVMVRFNDVQIKTNMDSYGQFRFASSGTTSQSMADDVLFVPNPANIIVNE